MKRIFTPIVGIFFAISLSIHLYAQGGQRHILAPAFEALLPTVAYEEWTDNSRRQLNLGICISALDNDSPELKTRLSELNVGIPFAQQPQQQSALGQQSLLWRWALLRVESSTYPMFTLPRWGSYEVEDNPLIPMPVSKRYYRGKLTLLDLRDDNTLFRDFRLFNVMLGKGLSSSHDSWRSGRELRSINQRVAIYGDALLGLGITSYQPYAEQLKATNQALYTGLETNAEAQLTIRYAGFYLQSFVHGRYILSHRPLTHINASLNFIAYIARVVELSFSYSRDYILFETSHHTIHRIQAGVRFLVPFHTTIWN